MGGSSPGAAETVGRAAAERALAPHVAVLGALAVLLAAGIVIVALNSLDYEGMWWDESASFWGSQGLSKYSTDPFAQRRGVLEVLRMNCRENLDPGGFHVLLHLWTKAGKGLAWLRSLPFGFMLLGTVSLGLLGWRLTRSLNFALAASAVPLLYPATLYFGFEIRAFSMEMAGVACVALLLVLALEKPSLSRLAALGLTCSAFLTSRYSFIFTVAGLVAAVFSVSVHQRLGGKKIARRLAVVVLPIAVVGVGIASVIMVRQMWPEMKGGGVGLSAPTYTHRSVLGDVPNAGALVFRNLFSPAGLPSTIAVLFFLFARRPTYALFASHEQEGPELAGVRERFSALYVLVFSIQVLSVAASLVGMYPWDIEARWSAYLATVSALSAIVLAAESTVLVRFVLSNRVDGGGLRRLSEQAGILMASLVVLAAFHDCLTHRQSFGHSRAGGRPRTSVALQIDKLPIPTLREGSVFVAFYEAPVLRYLYEYGPYSGRAEYPRVFKLETQAEWWAKVPIDADREGIGYIVSGLSLDEASARFPSSTLVQVGPETCRLLRVAGKGQPSVPE